MVAIESDIVVTHPLEAVLTVPSRSYATQTPAIDELLDALPSPVLVLDRDRVVVEANASAVEMFGDEVIGAYWGKSRGASERTLRHGTLVTIDTNNDRDDRLRELGRTQAALAHQIRNPLTVAGLSIEQLLLTQSGAEVRERLERVRDSLQAIEQQIRNALVFVRGELTERHTFAVTELVAAMRDAWSMLLDGRDVSWTESYCGRDFIAGDLATLVGALTNIVDNAIAIGGAHVKLTIAVEASLGALCVTITDNGPGMDADLLARARQPFVSGRPGGTGLGLAIVDAVVKAHGGRFSLDSAPGEGTRAHVELPLVGGAAR